LRSLLILYILRISADKSVSKFCLRNLLTQKNRWSDSSEIPQAVCVGIKERETLINLRILLAI